MRIGGTPVYLDLETDAVEAVFQGHDRPDNVEDNRERRTEKKIDHSLKETFPASDPPSASPGAD